MSAGALATENGDALDGVAIIRQYVDRICTANDDPKCNTHTSMKVLLLDAATTQVVSSVYSQTEILNQQVYLVSRLDEIDKKEINGHGVLGTNNNSGDDSSHFHAICFLRPTPHSIDLLARELQRPRFAAYHVFFSAILPKPLLQTLADADAEHHRVQQVHEMYADFCPVNEDLWTLQCRHTLAMTTAAGTSWAPKHAVQYERNLTGLQSMLLALKRKPTCIRYAAQSACAEELAKDLHDAIEADGIFHFRQHRRRSSKMNDGAGGGLLVLVLDRRDDPVTPLLSQWTYQAMVHELLGLNNHRVSLKGAPNVEKDLQEVVLSATQDDFFRRNRHSNFGKLGEEVQEMLQDYQKHANQHSTDNLNSIEDMQAFMLKFPEFRKRSHVVSKHVAVMGELSRLVEVCSLMDVSELEQELACGDDMQQHWRDVMAKLNSPAIKGPDKLRLGLLYALRYEKSANLHMLLSAMNKAGVPPNLVDLIQAMLRYAGVDARGPGLYGVGASHHLNPLEKMTKSIMSSVQGCDNVYAQHVPVLMDTIEAVRRGKLSRQTHPVVPGSMNAAAAGSSRKQNSQHQQQPEYIPDEILVFMVGGVTYEEGTKVTEFNLQQQHQQQQQQQSPGLAGHQCRVILAGSTVHNSTSFLDELKATSLQS